MTSAASQGPRLVGGGPQPETTPAASPAAAVTASSDGARQETAATALLRLQADLRKAASEAELGYFIANEARTALRAQQIAVFTPGVGGRLAVQTVSSLTTVDRASPMVLWLESIPRALSKEGTLDKVREFEAAAMAGQFGSVVETYPLRYLMWVPWLSRDGAALNGMILARATPWSEHDAKIATYLASAFAHAWAAIVKPKASRLVTRRSTLLVTAIAACLMAIPVPMTALAPAEIGPRQTTIVTAGIEGVVNSVEVEPNASVTTGQVLVRLNDTSLRNRAAIAEREALVAETKYKKAVQLAFVDARGRHEMAIARSELDLKLAERDYARELLARTEIRAERDGIAFFADKKDLLGKPVSVGEKLMEVADPNSSEFRIELPAADAVVLHERARVKVFLDSDPLNPVEARLVRAAYKAAPREAQQFAFRLVAEVAEDAPAAKLRLGMRGTAQIYSDQVPLGFYLFRRPIAAFRQWSGL